MGTLSRRLRRAATSRCGTGRASANGASGTASGVVMPWALPTFDRALLPTRAGNHGGGGKRDNRGGQDTGAAAALPPPPLAPHRPPMPPHPPAPLPPPPAAPPRPRT